MSYVCDRCQAEKTRAKMRSIGSKRPDTKNVHKHRGHMCRDCISEVFA